MSDSVYVAHEGLTLEDTPLDGHAYWKMKIRSIHQGKDTIWVIGYWFYSPSNLKDLELGNRCVNCQHIYTLIDLPFSISDRIIPLLGNTELVASNHLDVIDLQCIQGGFYLH